jgi:hypothetical protein
MTGVISVLWSVWGVLIVLLVGLKLYCDKVSQDEDDQIVLDDAFEHVKAEQAAIVAKVHQVEPVRRVVMWLTAAMSLVVLGYYGMDILNQFK